MGRPESREHQVPNVHFGQNVYQINQPHPKLLQPVPPGQLVKNGEPRMFQQHQTNSPQQMVRPTSRMMSPQPSIEPHMRPTSRENSNKKATFFSPQVTRDHYGIQPANLRYTQESYRQPIQQQQHQNQNQNQHQHQPSVQQYMTPKANKPMQ